MAIKNLFLVAVVLHNDAAPLNEGCCGGGCKSSPVKCVSMYVLARTAAQASAKVIKELGDQLLFIENINLAGSDDPAVFSFADSCVNQLIG